MKIHFKKHGAGFKDSSGFTLIEILIVVILLGILATIIIPQISVSSDDAKLNALKTNLANMRSAIELYYYQHDHTYPGENSVSGVTTADAGVAATAFLQQLTRFTASTGQTSVTNTGSFTYGPYLKGATLPTNPYNNNVDVLCDATETNITVRNSTAADNAWKFYTQTGVLIAADGTAGAHDGL